MPRNEKSGPRATGNRSNTLQGANDTTTVQPHPLPRHEHGQTALPIVHALAFPPSPGMKQAVLIVEHCPGCGWWHRHATPWPTSKLLSKRGRCGELYQLIPYVRRARKRAA